MIPFFGACFQTIQTHTMKQRYKTLLAIAPLLMPLAANALSGTWTSTASGNWSDTTLWSGGTVADGSGNNADFNTIDIPGAVTVTVDTARTIGSMTFGDTDTATAGSWVLAGANTLTLAGTSPTITTNVNTTVSTLLAGTSGFTKAGSGTLTVNSLNTGLSGPINLDAGTIGINKTSSTVGASVGSGTINMANGTQLRLLTTSATLAFISNPISLATGASVTFSSRAAGNGFSTTSISGDSNSVINIVNDANQAVSFSATGVQQLGSFNGTVNIASGNTLRFSSTSGPQGNGGANASFTVNGSVVARNGTTAGSNIVLGSLSGAGTLNGPSNSANTVIYRVGDKNQNSTFSGSIVNGGGGGFAALNKVGTGSLTLSGTSNTYTGATTVSAGTLFVTGALGNSAVTVNSGAAIGGNGTLAGNLLIDADGLLDVTLGNLTVSGTITVSDFSFADIIGWDATAAADGTYTLINGGTSTTLSGSTPLVSSPVDLSGGAGTKFGYFQAGSLQAVIYSVPEPSAILLGSFGMLALLRRRRA